LTRSEAYLRFGQGSRAAPEFQNLLDHPGIVINFSRGALPRLELGRAYPLEGGRTKASAAYEEFLALWKDPDPNVPILGNL
jgi:eukaryotic-like serine/threonine-protein kinase